jgi:hypothetical protein
VGIGTERSPDEDIEWFDLGEVADSTSSGRFVARALESLRADPLWDAGDAVRVLLVDLDNLRVETTRLRGRIAMAVALAREADHVGFAGQEGSVRRALPYLDEYGDSSVTVGNDHNEADEALLDVAAAVDADDVQFVVLSNDGIFARLAARGPLVVLSPGAASLSDELADAATRVVDLQDVESAGVEVSRSRARPAGSRRR